MKMPRRELLPVVGSDQRTGQRCRATIQVGAAGQRWAAAIGAAGALRSLRGDRAAPDSATRLRRTYFAKSEPRSANDLNSRALPDGSMKNIVACSPGSPLKRI